MLWKTLAEDDFNTDIIEVLREKNNELREQLNGLSRNDFSEVFLFFDYDAHQNNLGREDDWDVVAQMLESFDNETENGKLYISYPMVEALRDYKSGMCGEKEACYVSIREMKHYKMTSSVRSANPRFRDFSFEVWKDIINVFAIRVSCLLKMTGTLEYDRYSEIVSPFEIYLMEEAETQKDRVFVLSAFPEFLVDYFGAKLWKKCVKHRKNQREKCLKTGLLLTEI